MLDFVSLAQATFTPPLTPPPQSPQRGEPPHGAALRLRGGEVLALAKAGVGFRLYDNEVTSAIEVSLSRVRYGRNVLTHRKPGMVRCATRQHTLQKG
ncbi:hypothetical protein [Scytonema sp. PRP1]|uniref:hypothetical protein n=1 Tax=Scytonema sp. PRP1 TaxID=3120513 RepID=UPI002FD42FEB